jgi:hypothetical protein
LVSRAEWGRILEGTWYAGDNREITFTEGGRAHETLTEEYTNRYGFTDDTGQYTLFCPDYFDSSLTVIFQDPRISEDSRFHFVPQQHPYVYWEYELGDKIDSSRGKMIELILRTAVIDKEGSSSGARFPLAVLDSTSASQIDTVYINLPSGDVLLPTLFSSIEIGGKPTHNGVEFHYNWHVVHLYAKKVSDNCIELYQNPEDDKPYITLS